jgi:hypothetical protein
MVDLYSLILMLRHNLNLTRKHELSTLTKCLGELGNRMRLQIIKFPFDVFPLSSFLYTLLRTKKKKKNNFRLIEIRVMIELGWISMN